MDLDLVNLIDVTPSQVDVYNTAITEERLRSDASEKKNRPGTKRVVQVVLLVCFGWLELLNLSRSRFNFSQRYISLCG